MYLLWLLRGSLSYYAITHGHGFEIASFNASNLVYRKEQMLAPRPAHMGANAIFNRDEVAGGAPSQGS